MSKLLISGLIFLSSCGVSRFESPEFEEIFVRFERYAEYEHVNIADRSNVVIIQFGDMGKVQGYFPPGMKLAGYCAQRPAINQRTIYIDSLTWSQMNGCEKEELIFHELGHCILQRKHIDTTYLWSFQDKTTEEPISIMWPKVFCDTAYIVNHDYYIHELFSKEDE